MGRVRPFAEIHLQKLCATISTTAGNRQRKRTIYVKPLIRRSRKSVEGVSFLDIPFYGTYLPKSLRRIVA